MPRPLSFDRPKRLVRSGDFQRAFREGSRARGALLVVVARRNGLEGDTRLGLSIGRVVWKSAVKRNRVRRVFREAFRLEYGALPRGFDLVLVAASPKLDPAMDATRAELVSLARKAARRYDEKLAGAPQPAPKPRSPDSKPGAKPGAKPDAKSGAKPRSAP